MDQDLQRKIDEARAHGYSEAEINAALNPQAQQIPDANKRSEEHYGTAELGALAIGSDLANVAGKAIEYGAPAIATGYGINKYLQSQQAAKQAAQMAQQATKTVAVPQAVAQQNVVNGMPKTISTPQVEVPIDNTIRFPGSPTNLAQTAETTPGIMQRAAELGQRFAPALRTVGGYVTPVLQGVAKLGGVGGQALLHSGELNSNEDEIMKQKIALAKHRQMIDAGQLAVKHQEENNKLDEMIRAAAAKKALAANIGTQ